MSLRTSTVHVFAAFSAPRQKFEGIITPVALNPDPETRQPPGHVAPPAAATAGAFELVCARSGQSLHVPPDQSIIAVLLEAGLAPNYSCLGEGVCGACEIPVLGCDGQLDHRDGVLSAAERAAGKTLIVCVSRCKGTRLVLDI